MPEHIGMEISNSKTIQLLLGISPTLDRRKVPLMVGISLLNLPTLIHGRKKPTKINKPETKRRLDGFLKKSGEGLGVVGLCSTFFALVKIGLRS